MAKQILRDDQWKKIAGLLPGRTETVGVTAQDNRLFIEGVLWVARTGAHWRELPDRYGHWNSVFQRYNRWSNTGVRERLFQTLSDDPDFEYVMIDSIIVRVHQHSAGAKGGSRRTRQLATAQAV